MTPETPRDCEGRASWQSSVRAALAVVPTQPATRAGATPMRRMRPRCSAWALALLLLGVLGCGRTTDESGVRADQRDNGLGTVVDNTAPLWSRTQGWRIDSSTYTVVGAATDGAPPDLARVTSISASRTGAIAVADSRSGNVLLAERLDAGARLIGRRGSGPGEFETVFRTFFCQEDSLVVWDLRRRISVFDRTGRYVRQIPWSGTMLRSGATVHGVSPDCGAALVSHNTEFQGPAVNGRDTMRLVWYSLRDTTSQPVTELANWDRTLVEYGWTRRAVRPWTVGSLVQVIGTAAVVGQGDETQYQLLARDGSVERTVRWRATPRPVDRSERARYTSMRLREVQKGQESEEDFPPLDAFTLPSHMPYTAEMLVDTEQNVWLRRYETAQAIPSYEILAEEPSTWTVFDSTGRHLGEVIGPSGFRIMAISADAVFGEAERDDGGVEARAYPLVKGAAHGAR